MPKWVATHSPSSSRIWPDAPGLEGLVGHGDVRRERGHPAGDRPGVQVVDVGDTVRADQVLADHLDVDAGRRRLEQHAHAVAQQRPRARQDQHRDQQGGDRVGPVEAGGEHDQAGDDRGGRPERRRRAPRGTRRACSATRPRRAASRAIETRLATRPTAAKTSICAASTLDRVEQSSYAGDGEVAADPEQHDRVDQGGEDLGAVVAERPARRGGQRGDVRRGERQHDRGGVGEHVARVGEQGQRAGQDGADELDHARPRR